MKHLTLLLACAVFPLFGATPRIAVLDLGFAAGPNEFGCMSDPQVFLDALAPLGTTFRLSGEEVVQAERFCRDKVDLLVVPTGSAWPADAAENLVAYLSKGGALLTCGGYAFDRPVRLRNGRWQAIVTPPLASGVDAVALPEASGWRMSTSPDTTASVSPARTPEGRPAASLVCPRFDLWATAGMPVPRQLFTGRSMLSFRARAITGAKRLTIELDETDRSRWLADCDVSKASTEPGGWKEFRLSYLDFRHFGDSPNKARGKKGDHVNFNEVSWMTFGCGPNAAMAGKKMVVEFADLKTGVDAYADERLRKPPQINTRTARIRDAIHPDQRQINCFDPSFVLKNVTRLKVCEPLDARSIGLPDLSFRTPLSGYAAVAQLGVNGHGYDANRCALRPILSGLDRDGADCGPAASFVFHHSGIFAGSFWAVFGVDNADLFASADTPVVKTLLPEVARRLLARVSLNETTTGYACYRRVEKARLRTRVGNFGADDIPAHVRFVLRDEAGRQISARTISVNAKARANTWAETDFDLTPETPDYVAFTAELLLGTSQAAYDAEPGAFVVWEPKVLAGGPKLELSGSRFLLNGVPAFYMGAQTYWGQTRPTVARSPMSFRRDFAQMREAGLRFTRLFLPWTCEQDKRISDACVQLAQKFGLVIYHTQQTIPTMVTGKDLAAQNEIFREIAARYRDAPGFMIDIRNEPHMKLAPSWESARQMREWLDTNRAAARKGRAGTPVSVGWSQGWCGGAISKDPAWCSLNLDFTDRHYYGNPALMFRDLKDVDLRALGKPLIIPECGAKCHPTFEKEDPWGLGDSEKSYCDRFRCLTAQAFGLGATALFVWHWRDPIEGIFPCGLVHPTGVPREAAHVFAHMAKTFSRLRLADNRPDVVVMIREQPRMTTDGRKDFLERMYRVDEALKFWGANWSKVTESAAGRCQVKLTLDPETLPTADEPALRAEIGRRLKEAGCAFTRRPEDPDFLDTYRVPGEGATGWVFWNGGDRLVTTRREGREISVAPRRIRYLQISSRGEVEVDEEL